MFDLIALFLIGIFMGLTYSRPANKYPDGKCYLCRRHKAYPGEECAGCGTDQPLIK